MNNSIFEELQICCFDNKQTGLAWKNPVVLAVK